MKNWIKYLLLTLFPLLLVAGGKAYPISSSSQNFSSAETIKKSIVTSNGFSSLSEILELQDLLVEIDEEDYTFSGDFSGLSIPIFSYHSNTLFHTSWIWKKIELQNLHLLSLKDNIFILHRNLRI